MKSSIRTLGELGEDLILAPERWTVASARGGIPLGELVVERRDRSLDRGALVLDTTHARDGIVDLPAALRSHEEARSAKKVALAGDLLVSRLRSYLRQVALVHARALDLAGERPLAVSTEYYVLASASGQSLAYLVPFLLSPDVQALLAAAQEGGHHPRVPREAVLALRVPEEVVANRTAMSKRVLRALAAVYDASAAFHAVLEVSGAPADPRGTRDRSPPSSRGASRSPGRAAGRA